MQLFFKDTILWRTSWRHQLTNFKFISGTFFLNLICKTAICSNKSNWLTMNNSGLELLLVYYNIVSDDNNNELSLEDRRRWLRRIPRIAIRKYSQSAFKYMFDSGNDQALLNCCGINHRVFCKLVALFEPVFDCHSFDEVTGRVKKLKVSPKRGIPWGRPQEVSATGVLGLVLFWYRTRACVQRAIQLAFGLTASPMCGWLLFG